MCGVSINKRNEEKSNTTLHNIYVKRGESLARKWTDCYKLRLSVSFLRVTSGILSIRFHCQVNARLDFCRLPGPVLRLVFTSNGVVK